MDEIALQYDWRSKISLGDIERVENENKANDSVNLQVKFDLDYIANIKKDWLIKSRKNQKGFLSNFTKQDHNRFVKQIEKSFQRADGTSLM